MIRKCLKNKFSKSKNPIDIVKFKRQGNKVANLNKQAKFQYFEKLSVDFGKHVNRTSPIKIAIYKKDNVA